MELGQKRPKKSDDLMDASLCKRSSLHATPSYGQTEVCAENAICTPGYVAHGPLMNIKDRPLAKHSDHRNSCHFLSFFV